MSFEHDDSDYWTNTAGASGASCGAAPMSAPLLDIEHTPNVAPLDRQMGVMPPLTVPAELHDSLFGEGARGAQIYAILDGAKLEGLRELLEASKLDYACLFQGDAAIELGDVAPYIVRLEDGNRFTRRLFTTGTAPWQVWAKEAGILIRSAASLDDLRRHFRRFTRVQDETDAWFYLRFYEPQLAHDYLTALAHDPVRLDHWMRPSCGAQIDILTLTGPVRNWPDARTATWFRLAPDAQLEHRNTPFRIGALEEQVFAQHRRDDFRRRLDAHLSAQVPAFAALHPDDRTARIQDSVAIAGRFGIAREQAVADLALAAAILPMPLLDDPRSLRYLQADMHPLDKAARVLEHAKSLSPKRTKSP